MKQSSHIIGYGDWRQQPPRAWFQICGLNLSHIDLSFFAVFRVSRGAIVDLLHDSPGVRGRRSQPEMAIQADPPYHGLSPAAHGVLRQHRVNDDRAAEAGQAAVGRRHCGYRCVGVSAQVRRNGLFLYLPGQKMSFMSDDIICRVVHWRLLYSCIVVNELQS